MKTIGYVTAADPFHDRKAWSGTIYKVREAIENAGFNVFWIPVRLSFLHKLIRENKCFSLRSPCVAEYGQCGGQTPCGGDKISR